MKLPIDEYYGIAAEALCDVIENVDYRSICDTYIITCIRNRILNYMRDLKSKKRGGDSDICSLDAPLQEDPDATLHDIIASENIFEKNSKFRVQIDSILCLLNYREKLVLARLIDGHSCDEISKDLHTSRQTIDNIRRRIKNKYIAGGFLL